MDKYLRGKVRAVRGKGDLNPLPTRSTWELKACISGDKNCDEHLTETVKKFIEASNDGWLIYCGHSLKDKDDCDFNDKKFGPMSSGVLLDQLKKLKDACIAVSPAIDVLIPPR